MIGYRLAPPFGGIDRWQPTGARRGSLHHYRRADNPDVDVWCSPSDMIEVGAVADSVRSATSAPAARATDPATSHQAAASITRTAQRDAHRAVLHHLSAGPLSDFDLARLTGLKQTSIGVRRGELVKAGLVAEHDRGGVSDTGSACIRWALTAAGVAAAQEAVA